jgi:hypothetical protein
MRVAQTLEPRRKAKRPPRSQQLIEPALSFDPGPSMRQRSDGTLISRGPGAVQLIDVTDAKGNVVGRGARRRNVLTDLFAHGVISKRQHDAANRFLDDCSLASGGGLVANFLAMPTSPGPRSGLPETQTMAITRVRQVFHLLGLNSGTVFWWVIFGDRRLGDYDAAHKVQNGTASRMFKDALTALDENYNGKAT